MARKLKHTQIFQGSVFFSILLFLSVSSLCLILGRGTKKSLSTPPLSRSPVWSGTDVLIYWSPGTTVSTGVESLYTLPPLIEGVVFSNLFTDCDSSGSGYNRQQDARGTDPDPSTVFRDRVVHTCNADAMCSDGLVVARHSGGLPVPGER